MWVRSQELLKAIQEEPWAKGLPQGQDLWPRVMEWVERNVLEEFLSMIVDKVHSIMEIDPELPDQLILELATRHMVEFLGAHSASVRIYDPQTEKMLAYGSYPSQEGSRRAHIPLEGSVAGEVVRTRRTYLVGDLLEEQRYEDKEAAQEKGVFSMMAVPLEIPRFFPRERDTVGVIQIYFPDRGRAFDGLEVRVAELMAQRLSFVFARKKILSLYRTSEKKEAIVRKIFLKLGSKEGIKMGEVFNRVIPELADIINLQSCALFSVSEDGEQVVLEAGYPQAEGYHGIGKRFSIKSEPAFELVLNLGEYVGGSAYDLITPSYVLVMDPQRSPLLSANMKNFARVHNINSILYVPLEVGEQVNHFMTFDAVDKRLRYSEEEIDIFLFLGRELMKAHRMERLDDILHDFKNPAIATAGFARRLKRLLQLGFDGGRQEEIQRCVDILLEETSRLQELALSVYRVGEEQLVDLTERMRRRFEINEQAIKEQLKQNVVLEQFFSQEPLYVRCYPLHLERILDNLLNNATNAIPSKGGTLSVRTYGDGEWACAEISNTGRISEEDRVRLLEGESRGRGLSITHRIVHLIRGRLEVHVSDEATTFLLALPRHPSPGAGEPHSRSVPGE
jgi:signal transduction histidine kinase